MNNSKYCIMFIIMTVCFGLALPLMPTLVMAGQYTTELSFSTADQSMWGSGSAYQQDLSYFIGPTWNTSMSVGGIATDPLLGTDWGAKLWGSTSGKMGLEAGVKLDSGSVDINLPISVSLNYFAANSTSRTFTVNSSYSINSSAAMNTVFPTLIPKLDAVMQVASSLDYKACAGVCDSGNLFNFDTGEGRISIVELASSYYSIPVLPGDSYTYNLANNWVELQVSIPNDLNTTGHVSGGNLVSQTGAGAGEFLDARVNLLKFGEYLPGAVGAAFVGFNAAEEGSAYGVSWDALDVEAGIITRITQNFTFDPNPVISLYDQAYIDPLPCRVDPTSIMCVAARINYNSDHLVSQFEAGESTTVTLPDGMTSEQLYPVVGLDNALTNNTGLSFDPVFGLDALYASGYGLDLGPLFHYELTTAGISVPLFSNTFYVPTGLQSGDPFLLSLGDTNGGTSVPEPGTLALLGMGIASLAWLRRKHKTE